MKKKKNKVIENPIMVDKKNVKSVKTNNTSEDALEIKSFIIIVIVIAVLIGIIYGLTEVLKKEDEVTPSITTGSINYDKVSVGTLLNRPYDEYYVLVYNSQDEDAVIYSTLLTQYMQSSEEAGYTKIYYCDLDNSLNSIYYNVGEDDKSNPEASTTKEFDFGDLTLIKVEKGKITKYIEDYDSIKKILK